MQIALILLAGLGSAYLAQPRGGNALLIGLVGGLGGLSVAYIAGGIGGGLPLLVACGLALGLQGRSRGFV
jgi:hypothetical protein